MKNNLPHNNIMEAALIASLSTIGYYTLLRQNKRIGQLGGNYNLQKLAGEHEIYTAAGITKDSEPIYFGMEKIDDSNRKDWENYVNWTQFMVNESRGPLNIVVKFSKDKKILQNFSFSDVNKYLGFSSESEYQAYVNKLDDRKVYENAETIRGVAVGTVGFQNFCCFQSDQTYVAYISRRPVVGKFPFPNDLEIHGSGKVMTMKKYLQTYQDLIMTVASRMDDSDPMIYQNRGIFRNPLSFIEGGHRGLSLVLHGFTAAVTKTYLNKNFMKVSPAPNMRQILENKLTSNDYTKLDYGRAATEQYYIIKVDPLISLFEQVLPK